MFIVIVIALLATIIWQLWHQHIQGKYSTSLERRLLREKQLKEEYEQVLGLPFWSVEETEQALWARAHQGDKIAQELLLLRIENASQQLLQHANQAEKRANTSKSSTNE